MTKLEEKLIELGYECVGVETMSRLEIKLNELGYFAQFGIGYIKRINGFAIIINILANNELNYSICTFDTSWFIKFEVDNLQQTLDVLKQDLEVLKEYEIH